MSSYKDCYDDKGNVTDKGRDLYIGFEAMVLDPDINVTTGVVSANATNTGSSEQYSVVANEAAGIEGDLTGWRLTQVAPKTASNPFVLEAYASDYDEGYYAGQMTRCGNSVYDKVTPKAPKGPTDNPEKTPDKPKKKKTPKPKPDPDPTPDPPKPDPDPTPDPPKPDPDPEPEPKKPEQNITVQPGAEDLAGDGETHNDQQVTDEPTGGNGGIVEDNSSTGNDSGSDSGSSSGADSSSSGSDSSSSGNDSSSGSDSGSAGSSDSSSSGSSSGGSDNSGSSNSDSNSNAGSSSGSDNGSSNDGSGSSGSDSNNESNGGDDTVTTTSYMPLAAYLFTSKSDSGAFAPARVFV